MIAEIGALRAGPGASHWRSHSPRCRWWWAQRAASGRGDGLRADLQALAQLGFVGLAFPGAGDLLHAIGFLGRPGLRAFQHSQQPLLYRIAGIWGNHEGSLLLWVLILAIFGALVALFGENLPPPLPEGPRIRSASRA